MDMRNLTCLFIIRNPKIILKDELSSLFLCIILSRLHAKYGNVSGGE